MNSDKRKKLYVAINKLTQLYSDVDFVLGQEQDSLNNIPENLESSEMYSKIEESVENLEEALELIDEAKECLIDAC